MTRLFFKLSGAVFVLWLLSPFFLGPVLNSHYSALMDRCSSFLVFDRDAECMGVLPGHRPPGSELSHAGKANST